MKCLSDSGLPSQQTDELRTKISYAEMNRDDKAHRFVVSLNAFQDGNRLAYLALAIAIGIDSLIFMTGLFGANAVRSPLADVPSSKGRNSAQLEAIIENALLPDTLDNARATLNAMRPITNASGFMAEVRPEMLDPHTERQVLGVLNAGSTISAVDYDEAAGRYLVRAELYEFLSIVAKRSFEADKANIDLAELEKIVGVALLPDINQNAETVLHYMHPIDEDRGFTAEINLAEVIDGAQAHGALDAERRRHARTRAAGGQERRLLLHPPRLVQDAGAHPRPHADGRLRRGRASRAARRTASASAARSPQQAKAIEHRPAAAPVDDATTTEIRGGFVDAAPRRPATSSRKPGSAFPATPTSPPSPPTRRSIAPAAPTPRSTRCCASARTRRACRSTRPTRC